MSWSKVNRGKKPLGWWYAKIMCEFWYHYYGTSNRRYYYWLNLMCDKYKINLYGERL